MLSENPTSQPMYSRIEEVLLERIQKEYRVGQLLPTQKALAEEFNTSLITIKRVVEEIARKGLLESVRGRGAVVIKPQIRDDRGKVSSWTDSMSGVGRQPRTSSCRIHIDMPPPEIARALGLKAREKSVVVNRLRSLDGEPFCVMRNELPLSLVPHLPADGLTRESFYEWLKSRYDLVPFRAREEVEARPPTREESSFLGRSVKIVMVVTRFTFLQDHRPLEVAHMVAPATTYRYSVEISKKGS